MHAARSSSWASDRRRAVRFPVTIPVELDWGGGVTRDVSLSGVFFETEQWFAPGEPIRLTLVLERASPGGTIRVQCEGRVVRVVDSDTKTDVAVQITSHAFDR
ncbi:MAG: PilZ domain-containing protein [Candidatus Methylomirabilota bacterium]